MKAVWKFDVEVNDNIVINVPYNGDKAFPQQVLHCDTQNDHTICIWALVDTEQETRPVRIKCYGTGHDATAAIGLEHIGSVQLYDKRLVFHLFAEKAGQY